MPLILAHESQRQEDCCKAGQPGLHDEFQVSQYNKILFQNINQTKWKKKKTEREKERSPGRRERRRKKRRKYST